MPRILIAECMQEISSFNPLPSGYRISTSSAARRCWPSAASTPISAARWRCSMQRGDVDAGADHLGARAAAPACCRPTAGDGCRGEMLEAVRAEARAASTRSISRCTAPWRADGELDPEGYLLAEVREIVGTRHADRHLARPARHPDRPDDPPGRRLHDLPHLSARRFRRHRRPGRAAAAQDAWRAGSSR